MAHNYSKKPKKGFHKKTQKEKFPDFQERRWKEAVESREESWGRKQRREENKKGGEGRGEHWSELNDPQQEDKVEVRAMNSKGVGGIKSVVINGIELGWFRGCWHRVRTHSKRYVTHGHVLHATPPNSYVHSSIYDAYLLLWNVNLWATLHPLYLIYSPFASEQWLSLYLMTIYLIFFLNPFGPSHQVQNHYR